MRSNKEMLAWAASWHWPYLILSEREKTSIAAGEQSWREWVSRPDRKGKQQAWQRIDRWQQLAEKKGA